MRIRQFEVVRFGRLRDFGTGPEPLGDLVVVLGPNESGKTSLFHFLTALLYGIYPASRDTNPYTPWDGEGDIEGRLRLDMAEGGCVEVHRRLLSSPTGTLLRGNREENLRNQTIPALSHVPREVFTQVYALTLSELPEIAKTNREDGGGWRRLQDRLLLGMGARDLQTPRTVAAELESEAGALWRRSRRGNQEIRDLDKEIAKLRGRRREVADGDRELRESARRLEEARAELAEARWEVQRLRIIEERIDRLLPLRNRLARLSTLEDEVGDATLLEGIPSDPEAKHREIRGRIEEIEAAVASLTADAEVQTRSVEGWGGAEKRALERETEIRSITARAGGGAQVLTHIGSLEQEIRDAERRCRGLGREIFSVPLEEVDPERVRRVPIAELREAISKLQREREDRRIEREARERARSLVPPPGPIPAWLAPALVTLALGLLGAAAVRRDGVLFAAAALSGIVAAGFFLGGRRVPGELDGRDEGDAHGERDESTAGAGAGRHERDIQRLLEDLPVTDAAIRAPGGDLARTMEDLQEGIEGIRDRQQHLDRRLEELEALRRDIQELGRACDIELPEDPGAAAVVLGQALESARTARGRAEAARVRLDRIEADRLRKEARLTELRERLAALEDRLRILGEGDLERGLSIAGTRLEARTEARVLRKELERDFPDLESDVERIREVEESGDAWVLDDEVRARNRFELDELQKRIEALAREEEGLEAALRHGREEDTVDRIDGGLEELKLRRERLARERDRKWLMARLIREADHRFRERHQPEVIRRAGEYIEAITGGRYDGLILADGDEKDIFRLRESGGASRVPVAAPLSTGTRDQVYLALRLASVDQLDASGERLPLFIDEVFVTWDSGRRERGFELLARAGEHRQVFVFTCHPEMAEELKRQGADVLELEGC